MSAQIRDYNPSTDADAVSEFYNRNHYGPARDAGVLTGRQLNLVLAERGVHMFLIAEDRGRVVGTIGYLRVSGRRVSRDDELFAGMFVIDPGYRAGFLAGRLFTTSFGRLLEDGIATLRVEVNPVNVKALPLYVRVGFRSVEAHPQPDQDGYIELVSHMPGVVSRLLRELAADVPLTDVFATFSWRTMAGGRNRSISHGVTVHDGEVVVEYDFTVRGDAISVRVRMQDGAPVDTTINGIVTSSLPSLSSLSSLPEPVEGLVEGLVEGPVEGPHLGGRAVTGRHARREVAVGDYTVEVDADGTMNVRHPSYAGAVYRDALASVEGRPSAWRRPAAHSPLITEHRGGWLLAWQVDEVRLQKEISIEDRTVTTVVRSIPSRTLAAEPWSSIRGATVRTFEGDSPQYRAPNAPGLWPRDLVDFEAAVDPEPSEDRRRILIDEPVSGMGLGFEWNDSEFVRVEGQPLGRATSSSSVLRYSLTLGAASQRDGEFVDRHPDGIEHTNDPAGTASPAARDVFGEAWVAETRGRFEAIVARSATVSSELVVVADRGVVCWTALGHDVLTSPFPTSRTLGPIDDWAAGLWVCTQSARDDVEQGVGWGGSPRVGYSSTPPESGPSWSIDVLDDSVAALRLNLRAGASPTDPEIVAHLTPRVWGPTVFIPSHPTGWWALDRSKRRWSCFARAARIPLAEDRVLVVAAGGVDDELLIRSSADTFLVSLISRAESADADGGSWHLSVETPEVAR